MKKVSFVLIILGIINFVVGFVFLYLSSTMNFVKLVGGDVIYSTVGDGFTDPGVEVLKNKDDVEIITEGNVDSSKVGEYEITYKVMYDGEEVESYKRKVKVVDNKGPNISSKEDVNINLDTKLNDETVSSVLDISIEDNYDKKEDVKYEIDYSNVDTSKEGEYEVVVKATDKTGNVSNKSVKVKVKKVNVESIKLNKDSLSLSPGATFTLKATVLPDNAYDKNVTWSSDNSSVAKVDSNGKVTANGVGTTNVCVQSSSNSSVRKCITVTVKISAKQKLINSLVSSGYKKKNDNVYYRNTDTLTYTFDFSNKYFCTNDGIGEHCYYYKKNVGYFTYYSDKYVRYSTYNFNTSLYSCSTDPTNYYSLCNSSNLKGTTINLLSSLKDLFNSILKTAGVVASEI